MISAAQDFEAAYLHRIRNDVILPAAERRQRLADELERLGPPEPGAGRPRSWPARLLAALRTRRARATKTPALPV
ncbi:MAG TPA: hypothetical protein VKV26_09800 [Dehalococcoidia bacterium]|nr:hypothetical protein [Dehalococcoidia bacterium]